MLADLGEEPEEEDLPPALEWEGPLWGLYQILQRQWRMGFKGAAGLDMAVFIPVIRERNWDLALSLELLGEIEDAVLSERDD